MTVGSLFAGIGGFDLGLERAGMTVKWQVEIDPFCRAVLAKHWPDVRRYEDVRDVHALYGDTCDQCLPPVDVLCGGFPCQDISSAGKKVGISGARSGLWGEFARLIRTLRPRFVIVENVAAFNTRAGGLGRVLGDLAACGYDAEWESLPAALFGAPHLRTRTFVVGYADAHREPNSPVDDEASRLPPMVANAEHAFREQRGALGRAWGSRESVPWDADGRCVDPALAIRMDDGLPDRMDRLAGLGNAVIPQITEWIGRRVMQAVESDPDGHDRDRQTEQREVTPDNRRLVLSQSLAARDHGSEPR